MEKLKKIIGDNNMSSHPEYYSGRGATMSDLNGEILEGIYQGILKEYGENAAKNFVKMVADIKVLSATTFLQELFDLFYNKWKYTEKENHALGVSVGKNEDGEYDETSAIMGEFGMLLAMSNDRDDTNSIRSGFLYSHGIKPKKGEIIYNSFGDCYYDEES